PPPGGSRSPCEAPPTPSSPTPWRPPCFPRDDARSPRSPAVPLPFAAHPSVCLQVYSRLPREGRRRVLERDRAVEAVRMNGGAERFEAALRDAGAQKGGREVWEELAERYGERWRRGVCLLAVRWGRSSWLCRT